MRGHFLLALAFLATAATIGAMLRLVFVVEMPWLLFTRWLDAHSHLAMLGWLLVGSFIALLDQENSVEGSARPKVPILLSLAATLGMAISYILTGHGTGTIAFSALQNLATYSLVWAAWARTASWPSEGSRSFARIALCALVISTIGVWALGYVIAAGLQGTEMYYWLEQFVLHFQINGWLWFAAMAVGSRWAELHGVPVRLDRFTIALWLVSAILTFALVIAWSERFLPVVAVNSLGVLLQFWAAWRTLMAMKKARPQARVRTTRWMRVCIGMLLLAMGVKVTIQAAVAVPAMADMALTIRNYVIGFIHINTLGAFTSLLFAHALMRGWFDDRRATVRLGLVLFFSGVLLTESLLFLQGTLFWMNWGLIPGYYWTLFAASVLLPLGVVLLLISAMIGRRNADHAPTVTG